MLHTIAVPGEQTAGAVRSSLRRSDELEGNIQTLASLSIIEEHECRGLRELARAYAPEAFDVGLVPRRFCAENMLVDDDGHVHVIDNETLMIDPYNYDLAPDLESLAQEPPPNRGLLARLLSNIKTWKSF